MTWNYQLVKHKDYIGLHEVYYDNGVYDGRTVDALLIAETKKEMIEMLELMLKDIKKRPILKDT